MRKNQALIQHGFTLVELMITLSVAAILLAVAVPSYQVFIQDSRLTAQSNNFYSAMTLAKSESVKSSSPTTICPSTNGTSCTGGTVWSNGWLIFADPDSDGVVDTGERIIQVGSTLVGGNTLTSVRTRVTYSASGFALGFNSTFSLCDSRGAAYSKRLILNNQGRLRIETGGGTCP